MKMSNKLRITLALILSFLFLTLAGCSSGTNDPGVQNDTWDGTGGRWPESGGLISSIFRSDITYDSYTPAEDIALPVESSRIEDVLQIGKNLFIVSDDKVYSLDLESGESAEFCGAEFAATYGESLFTYYPESGKISEYSTSGELVSEQTLIVRSEELEVEGFYVTDDYYVFVCLDSSGNVSFTQYNAFDRETSEEICSYNETATSYRVQRVYSSYKKNSLLKAEANSLDPRNADIYELNFDDAKATMLTTVSFDADPSYTTYDIAYNKKKDTVIALIGPKSSADTSALRITEFALDSTDNVIQQKFFITPADNSKYFVCVYENIVTAICSADNEYRYLDYLNPPESITLACSFASLYNDVISGFEKETGILVRTVNYGADSSDRLDFKLMAGDTDFDLFIPVYKNQHKYFNAGMYEDLSNYDSLKQRLDGNLAAGFISGLGDTYVGMPISIGPYISKETYPGDGSPRAYSIVMSELLYLANNVNVTTGTYLDPDGDELYKLLKFIYDNPNGNEDEMPFSDDCMLISCEFVIMNPSSKNKENCVKFLEYLFDTKESSYIHLDSTENVYSFWKSYAWSYVEPVFDAANSISRCDGKNSTIKDIAREAAAEVDMRLNE